MANIFDNVLKFLQNNAQGKLDNYNAGPGPTLANESVNKTVSNNVSSQKQEAKAYNQPFLGNEQNYTTVSKPVQQPVAYNQPYIANQSVNKSVDTTNQALINLNKHSVINSLNATKQSMPESKTLNAMTNAYNKASNTVSNIYNDLTNRINEMNQAKIDDRLQQVRDNNQQLIDNASQEDLNQLIDEQGNLIDYSEIINQLNNRKSMLEVAVENNPNAKNELDEINKELQKYEGLAQLRQAIEENSNLNVLDGDDSDYARAYREQLSHKNDNGLERAGNALDHLIMTTLNIVPTVLDQAKQGGNTRYAVERLDELKEMLNNGSITEEEYENVLGYWNNYIEEFRATNEDNLSQKIRSISDQVSANTFYGASDVEKFVLQAGESTAQFLLHYALFKGASIVSMGVASGSDKANQLLSQGYDYETSMKNGFMTFFVACLTEHLPIEGFENYVLKGAGDKVVSHVVNSLAIQSMNEGIEELAEGLLDPLIDSITLGTPYGVDGTELLNSFMLGAASGGMGGAIGGAYSSLNIKINSKRQMNALQNEINYLESIIPEMAPEYQAQALSLITEAKKTISDFKAANSFLDAFYSPSDEVTSTSVNEDVKSIYETLTPDFNNEVQENRALDEIQEIIKSELVNTELSQLDQYEKALDLRGVSYEQLDFSQLNDEQKMNVNVTAEYAHLLNRDVMFANLYDNNGNPIDGVFVDGKIVINPNGNRGALSTMIHEYTHGMESSKYYNRLKGLIKKELGSDYDILLDAVKDAYSGIEGVDFEKELVATRTQDLLSNPEFVDRLVKYNNSLARRLYEDIKNLFTFTDTVSDIEYNFMRAFTDASRTSENKNDPYYSSFFDLIKEVKDESFSDRHVDITRVEMRNTTPQVLIDNVPNFYNRPMIMDTKHIKSVTGEDVKGLFTHQLSDDILAKIPYSMEDPIAIFKHKNLQSTNMVLKLKDLENRNIIVAIKPNTAQRYLSKTEGNYEVSVLPTNYVKTTFGVGDNDVSPQEYFDTNVEIYYYPEGMTNEKLIQLVNHETHDHAESVSEYSISNYRLGVNGQFIVTDNDGENVYSQQELIDKFGEEKANEIINNASNKPQFSVGLNLKEAMKDRLDYYRSISDLTDNAESLYDKASLINQNYNELLMAAPDPTAREHLQNRICAYYSGYGDISDYKYDKSAINLINDPNDVKNRISELHNQEAELNNSGINDIDKKNYIATNLKWLEDRLSSLNRLEATKFDRTLVDSRPNTVEQQNFINKLDRIKYKLVGDNILDIYALGTSGDSEDIGKYTKEELIKKYGTDISNLIIADASAITQKELSGNDIVKDFSSLKDPEVINSAAKEAEKAFGVTSDADEVGYIDTNGKWIDFSGKRDGAPGGYRTMDHREMIGDYRDFIALGNIRMFPETGGFEVVAEPNQTQINSLRKWLKYSSIANDEGSFVGVSSDASKIGRYDVATFEYEAKTNPDTIINDVLNSFNKVDFSLGIDADELLNNAKKDLKQLSDSTRRVNLKNEINEVINEIRSYGQIEPETYNALREKVVDSTYAKVPNDAYDVARDIRRIMGSNFLKKEGWDKTINEINEKYHIIDEDNSYVTNSYQDARDFISDYISGLGSEYSYVNPVEAGYMTDEEFDHEISSRINKVINDIYETIDNPNQDELIDELIMSDAEGNYQDVRNTLGQIKYDQETGEIIEDMDRINRESLDALLNSYENTQQAFENASIGNYSPEMMNQLEEEAFKNVTIDQAKQETSVLKDVNKNKPLRTLKETLYQVRQKIFDKGIAIRDMKDKELSAKYDYLLNSENMANRAITDGIWDKNGKKVGESLVSISKMIPEEQKNDFDYYMYHKHNVDAAKIGKNVFFGFPAAKSQQIVNQYEALYPDFVKVAEKYYAYNDLLLQRQVESGVITRQTAEKWKEMYPHYVPTKRLAEAPNPDSLIETADPKVTSSNKGTLYERTGGVAPIQPLDYAMAEHTKQVYKSSLFNNFAKEYVRASFSEATSFNEMYGFEDIIEGNEDNLVAADENTPATLIWYDAGERKIVQIPESIYDALGPTQTPFDLPSNVPFVAWATKLRTNMITGANPVFWLTNGFKDFQDIGFNSKYAMDTYLNLPRAYYQLMSNGDIANVYKANGGEYQTYSSEVGVNQNDHNAFYNATISNFVKFNEMIEMAPRLAEFMSSLDHGDSIETAMYNAAEVTTNFKRGGDFAKWMNRNGFAFFNASIQGFDKQVRNITDAYDSKGWKGIVSYMAKATLLSGVPLVVLNGLLHKDDEDYDKLSDYIKDNYYILWKYDDGKFVRIPKGRIANAYQEIMSYLYDSGVELAGDDSADKKARTLWDNSLETMRNVWEQIGINGLEGNNILSPAFDVLSNEAWYGDPIVSQNMSYKAPEDQYDESTDLFSIWLGNKLKYSPKKINYLVDQYSGGAGDVILPMLTQKAETGLDDGTIKGKVSSAVLSPLVDKFTADSVFKNQDVTDFFTLDEELTAMANKEYASDESILASKYINSIQYQMNQLYAERRNIYNDTTLTDSEKYNAARDVQRQIDDLAKLGIETYDQLDIGSYYGNVNGVSYYKNNSGEWTKVDADKQAIIDSLNLSTEEKSNYFYATNSISQMRKDVKADTPEGENADYKPGTIEAIKNSGLSAAAQNQLYDSYYGGKITDNINGMDISDEEKFALKVANAEAKSAKDANGNTISNSKALDVADKYADEGLLDDVFDYIARNGIQPADMGLTKTVYGYSYDKMASEYAKVFGQQFGTGGNVELQDYSDSGVSSGTTYTRLSGGTSRSSRSSTSKEEKARQQQFEKLKKALLNYLKSVNTANSYSSIQKNMTTVSDAKAKAEKTRKNAYKG